MIGRILIFISLIVFSVAPPPEPPGPSTKTIDLYYTLGSAPCRAVMLTAKYLDINLNLKPINLFKDEHKDPKFLKINPLHTIPTLVDGKFIIPESHAIVIYLVEKYGDNDLLYPKNIEQHILVLQRLFFNATVLYLRFTEAYYPLMRARIPFTDVQIKKIDEAFEFLDLFLEETEYIAGNQLTVADFCILASVTTIQATDYDMTKNTNVLNWLEKTKAAFTPEDYEEANGKGVKAFQHYYLQSTTTSPAQLDEKTQ